MTTARSLARPWFAIRTRGWLPNIHENLGKLLLHLGRRAEADEHFAMAKRMRETVPQNQALRH